MSDAAVNLELYITPGGNLQAAPRGGGAVWRDCFAAGNGAGLLAVLEAEVAPEAAPSFLFVQRLTREFAMALARLPEVEWSARCPDEEFFERFAMTIPEMTGAEYCSGALLRRWYGELDAALRQAAAGDPLGYLQRLNPAWCEVGKIGFHLAENKNDTDGQHPFLFLCTYIHRLSLHDQPRHLPLAKVLERYAGDRAALLRALLPLRSAAAKSAFLNGLLESSKLFEPGVWSAREAYDFLQDVPLFEAEGILVRMVNLWKQAPKRLQVGVELDVAPTAGKLGVHSLLRFNVAACLGGDRLSAAELAKLLDESGRLVRFKGEWIQVDAERIAGLLARWQQAEAWNAHTGISLVQGLRLLAGCPENRSATPFGGIAEEERPWCRLTAVGALRQLSESGTVPDRRPFPGAPETLRAILRPYQTAGVQFLWERMTAEGGACLADDMGLGKTLQVLSWLELLRRDGVLAGQPALLVLPASLLRNWQLEAEKFTPALRFGIWHASALTAADRAAWQADPDEWLTRFDLVATTYAGVLRTPELANREFAAIILDEAQAIKNPDSNQSRAVRRLRAGRRLALTGTPVENRLSDLWSIFDFALPGLLGGRKEFQEMVRKLTGADGVTDYAPLRRLTRPYLLRRLKSDKQLVPDLPDKTEMKVYCRLTPMQAALYHQVVQGMMAELKEADDTRRKGVILSRIGQLKQICNHPAQYTGTGEYEPAHGGKFSRLAELLETIAARQEKVLVFTQFREMTEPLHEYFSRLFGRTGLILHGGTPVGRRAELVTQFQREIGAPFFILSLKAAGTGLNLTAANHVIHFDRWWNPAVENQATDRAYRIGQHRNVLVHKLVCRGTIEEKIDAMIAEKQQVAEELFAGGAEPALTGMSDAELWNLIRLEE